MIQYSNLNEEQHAVVFSDESKILCIAGAGAGKTFSMIARVSRLVEDGVDPESILVLTFTRAAAFEMQSRYEDSHPGAESIPEFRTFHGFCYSILSKDEDIRQALGYSKIPDVVDDAQAKAIKTKAAMQVGSKLSQAKILGKATLTPKEEMDYQILMKAYKRLMKQENVITYDELSTGVCNLFRDDAPVTYKYKNKFKHIFIDEFQDTDKTQWDFAQSFVQSNLFACGDALQAIYAFRGADSSIIKQVSKDPAWKTYKLFRNYRSTTEICNFANELSTYADPEYRIEMAATKNGPEVIVHNIEDRPEYGHQFSEHAYDLCSKYISESVGSTAILCRTNAQVDDICARLDDCEISYFRDKSDTYTIDLLNSARDSSRLVEWLASNLSSAEYNSYIRYYHMAETDGIKYDIGQFLTNFGTSDSVSSMMNDVSEIHSILECDLGNSEKLSRLVSALKVDIDTNAYSDGDIIDFIIESLNAPQEKPRIYVGTIHSVKGLEYDNVIVMGVDGRSFRLSGEENKNLYYVAITRAKTNLEVLIGD